MDKFISFLKEIQKLTFLFMIMGGLVITGMAAWYTTIIAYGKIVDQFADVRLHTLSIGLYVLLGLIACVIVALAFGKVEKFNFHGATVSGEIDFDSSSDHEHDEDHNHDEEHHEDEEPTK